MSLLLLLQLLGYYPTVAEASIISPITVVASSTTVPLIINAYAYRAGLSSEDADLLNRISWCESEWEPLARGYNKRNGKVWSVDIGPMQINSYYHGVIDDPFENIAYGISLYQKNGTRDWLSSKSCWGTESG